MALTSQLYNHIAICHEVSKIYLPKRVVVKVIRRQSPWTFKLPRRGGVKNDPLSLRIFIFILFSLNVDFDQSK